MWNENRESDEGRHERTLHYSSFMQRTLRSVPGRVKTKSECNARSSAKRDIFVFVFARFRRFSRTKRAIGGRAFQARRSDGRERAALRVRKCYSLFAVFAAPFVFGLGPPRNVIR